jgi:hypothetical protein
MGMKMVVCKSWLHIIKSTLIYEQCLASYLLTAWLTFNISGMTCILVGFPFLLKTRRRRLWVIVRFKNLIYFGICLYGFAVLKLNLIFSQAYLPNSELFVQTYPLWHLIISQNHVFDCFRLSSDNNSIHPIIQQRQSNNGLKTILVLSQCTRSIKFYRTHVLYVKL